MKKFLFVAASIMLFSLNASSQALRVKDGETNYDRSSLYMVMVEDKGLVNAEVIKKAYHEAPMPDKFNDHNLGLRCFTPTDYPVTEEDHNAFSTKYGVRTSESFGAMLGKSLASEATGGLVDSVDIKNIPVVAMKVFEKENVARDIVAKWFCRDSCGNFHTDLVIDRGHYNASSQDAMKAILTARGLSALGDAGVELISNTFVVVTRFNYLDKKEVVEVAKGIATAFLGSDAAGLNSILDATIKGYVVKSTSFLYKLNWNDTIQNEFYERYYVTSEDTGEEADAKRLAFNSTDLFSLEFIGSGNAWADVSTTAFSNKTQDFQIHRATVRSLDAVIAKLQKSYEQFRTKTPLISTEPLSASIGLKEGVEPGDKYEVLQKTIDPEKNSVKYVRMGVIKADRSVWDNRYNAEQELLESKKGSNEPTVTTFKGSAKDFAPGMLIRQIN